MKIEIEVNDVTKKLSIKVTPFDAPAVDVVSVCKIIANSTTELLTKNPHIHEKNIRKFPFDRLIKESVK